MLDTLQELSALGLQILGWIVFAGITTAVVITGIMVVFLIYKKVFMPQQKQAESLQYKLLKDFIYPMVKTGINDLTQKGMDAMESSEPKQDSKKEPKKDKNEA